MAAETSLPSLPPVFVINMLRDEGRRAAMSRRAGEVGLALEFFPAVDGRALSSADLLRYDSLRRRQYFGRDLTPGEIGCLLSHRRLYEKIVAENIPVAVILEDDVIFEPDVRAVFAALPLSPVPWDVVRFLGSPKIYKRGCRRIAPLVGGYWLARLPTTPGGAHGYMIRKSAAAVMLRHMERNWLPIDTLQGRSWETGLETLVVHPAPLFPDQSAVSTIGEGRFDKSVRLEGFDRLVFPLRRGSFKMGEMVGKKAVYFSSFFRDRKWAA